MGAEVSLDVIEVQAGHPLRIPPRQRRPDAGAEIAAVHAEGVVPELGHQRCPLIGHEMHAASRDMHPAGKSISHERGNDEIERRSCVAGEIRDELHEFEERSRPPVSEYEGARPRPLSPDMEEMELMAVD